jgi:hypothetical protein
MTIAHFDQPPHVSAITVDGKEIDVTLRVAHDGIEYVGRLWFTETAWDDAGLPDRAAFCGRTPEDALAMAHKLSAEDFVHRYHRAVAEKRRFHALRKVTDEMLAKIRYMNQLSISIRAGLLDLDGVAQEIEMAERQLHELVNRLRDVAGLED